MPDPSIVDHLNQLRETNYPPPDTNDRWVFINMPISRSYDKIQFAIIFALYYLGFYPRSCLETEIGRNEERYPIITALIQQSKYSIHDLSYVGLDPQNHLPRFNMPFELGLARGFYEYHPEGKSKKIYAFSRRNHEYRTYCSDIQGIDYGYHERKYQNVLTNLRRWLSNDIDVSLARGNSLVTLFDEYYKWVSYTCRYVFPQSLSTHELSFKERLHFTQYYLIYKK
jgi:hypothetical protein